MMSILPDKRAKRSPVPLTAAVGKGDKQVKGYAAEGGRFAAAALGAR